MNKTSSHRNSQSSIRYPELTAKQCKRSFLYSVSVSESCQYKKQTLYPHTPQMLKQVQHDECLMNNDISTMNCNFFNAFTLAEVMIVLAIIGILTAILLPVAHNSTPNENILKFKKAHNTLHTTIRELVNSNKYFLDGDLGVKTSGDLIDGTHEKDNEYFCNSFADVANIKENNCNKIPEIYPSAKISYFFTTDGVTSVWNPETSTSTYYSVGEFVDNTCKDYSLGGEKKMLVFQNNVIFYETWPNTPFGFTHSDGCGWSDELGRCLNMGERVMTTYTDNGMLNTYKVLCFDIDGIEKGEEPFGYGVRVDGKILNGARADIWLQKSIQEK